MDFNDQPSASRQISWKLIAIIAGGIVLAGLIVGGVMYFTHPSGQETSSRSAPASIFGKPSGTASDACAGTPNADACRIAKAKDLAITSKKSDGCDALKDADKDDCLWSVARVAQDVAICAKIHEKDFVARCTDERFASLAITASNSVLCDKIQDEQTKEACKTVIASEKSFSCEKTDTDCELSRIMKSANLAQDADVCNILDPKRGVLCKTSVLVNDPDRDGLDSTQEIVVYHTDPRKADTDGDGYSDGAEVKSGHDPLKK